MANIYFGSSVRYEDIVNVDSVLESTSNVLLEQLGIDLSTRDAATVHIMGEGQTSAIKSFFEHAPGTGNAWYSCCEDGAGVWATLGGTWPLQSVTHEYVHHALYNEVDIPLWLNEGLATYYEIEMASSNPAGPFDSTGDVYWHATAARQTAAAGQLIPLTAPETDWDQTPSLRYSQGYMAARHIIDLYGHEAMTALLENLFKGDGVATAISQAMSKPFDDFEAGFVDWLLVWGEDDQRFQGSLKGSAGQIHCHGACSRAGVQHGDPLKDLVVEATFTNPIGTSQFKYGFDIRELIEIRVDSDRTWYAGAWTAGWSSWELVEKGGLSGPFDTSLGGSNHLEVTALGDRGCLFVNEEPISCFELPSHAMAEPVQIVSHYGDVWYSGYEFRALEAEE